MTIPASPPPIPAAATPAMATTARGPAGAGDVTSTLGGVVESITVAVGQAVNRGDKVAIIEAMKMKAPMVAHRAGRIAAIHVREGEGVEAGQALVTID